jgi:hypothetical protein
MSSPISNTGPDASDESPREKVLDLGTARNMLPLVRRIISDITKAQKALDLLLPEQENLDRKKRILDWAGRSRRYQIGEELADQEHNLQDAMAELEFLGIDLLDPVKGQVGFPTIVNGRDAFFSWWFGEDDLTHWHFSGEKVRRRIPSSWTAEAEVHS